MTEGAFGPEATEAAGALANSAPGLIDSVIGGVLRTGLRQAAVYGSLELTKETALAVFSGPEKEKFMCRYASEVVRNNRQMIEGMVTHAVLGGALKALGTAGSLVLAAKATKRLGYSLASAHKIVQAKKIIHRVTQTAGIGYLAWGAYHLEQKAKEMKELVKESEEAKEKGDTNKYFALKDKFKREVTESAIEAGVDVWGWGAMVKESHVLSAGIQTGFGHLMDEVFRHKFAHKVTHKLSESVEEQIERGMQNTGMTVFIPGESQAGGSGSTYQSN
jgi:hypothetical protein